VAKRERMTEAEQKAWEAEMKAAGIRIVTDAPTTVTLLRRKTTEALLAEARAAGVEVTVSTRPPRATGEIALLPGVRRPTENEREAT
jgi:hypothetical protein